MDSEIKKTYLLLVRKLNIQKHTKKMYMKKCYFAHGGGRVVSASGSETSVSSSMPTSATIYDAYTSIIKKKKKKMLFSRK